MKEALRMITQGAPFLNTFCEPASEEQRRVAVEESVMHQIHETNKRNRAQEGGDISGTGLTGDSYLTDQAEVLWDTMASQAGTVSRPEPKISARLHQGNVSQARYGRL